MSRMSYVKHHLKQKWLNHNLNVYIAIEPKSGTIHLIKIFENLLRKYK